MLRNIWETIARLDENMFVQRFHLLKNKIFNFYLFFYLFYLFRNT